MKKHFFKLIICAASLSAIAAVYTSCRSKASTGISSVSNTDPLAIPDLYERNGDLAKAAEWPKTIEKVGELKAKLAANPNDIKTRLQVAAIFLSEVRVTGQSAYYYPAIIKILDGVLSLDAKNFEAWVYKSSVKMSLHQFAEAKELAEKARQLNPDNAYVYGMLTDANTELGNYTEAIAMSDKMQSLKPSLESYSRVSYLREIFGDYPGAIEAMKMAVAAGIPGTESGEWARVALGDLYLATGKADKAEEAYRTSLETRPGYPAAEIGMAKLEKARKNYDSAIAHTKNAIRVVSESGYVSLLGELYYLNGDNKKAVQVRVDVVELLEKAEKENAGEVKHNGNRELAMAYLQAGQLDKALVYAQDDLQLRPGNIDANELVAWIAYLKGDDALARACAEKMLQTNTGNAEKLYKAGLIYKRTGDVDKGNELLARAKAVTPFIDEKITGAGM